MTFFFFFNDTATTEIYTLSLHDALPISPARPMRCRCPLERLTPRSARFVSKPSGSSASTKSSDFPEPVGPITDRKSTRLNSSHSQISYAVFCLKKKKKHEFPRWRQDSYR